MAWDRFANEKLPPDVEFFHGSDEQFVTQWEDAKPQPEKFNLVVLNYAVNHDKAVRFAKTLVAPGGHLLAPTNVQNNYWFAQQYERVRALPGLCPREENIFIFSIRVRTLFVAPVGGVTRGL